MSGAKCPICYEPFKHDSLEQIPKILSCGHSLCHNCLNSLPESFSISGGSIHISCPMCRKVLTMKDKKEVPMNFSLLEVLSNKKHLDGKEERKKTEEDEEQCSKCKNAVSLVMNEQDGMMYCAKCSSELPFDAKWIDIDTLANKFRKSTENILRSLENFLQFENTITNHYAELRQRLQESEKECRLKLSLVKSQCPSAAKHKSRLQVLQTMTSKHQLVSKREEIQCLLQETMKTMPLMSLELPELVSKHEPSHLVKTISSIFCSDWYRTKPFFIYQWLDVFDQANLCWRQAQVVLMDKDRIKVHFLSGSTTSDEWISQDSSRIERLHSCGSALHRNALNSMYYKQMQPKEYKLEMMVEVMDSQEKWLPAQVIGLSKIENTDHFLVKIHYQNWADRWDEWLYDDSYRIRCI